MASGSKGDVAYTIVEANSVASEEALAKISAVEGVFGVREFTF